MRTFHAGEFRAQLTLFFTDAHGLGSIVVTVAGTAGGDEPHDENKQGQP